MKEFHTKKACGVNPPKIGNRGYVMFMSSHAVLKFSKTVFGCNERVMLLFKSLTRVPTFHIPVHRYFILGAKIVRGNSANVHVHVDDHDTSAHFLEVVAAAKVLRDGDGVVQVEHCVVPPSGHEDGVAGVLHELVDLDRVPVLASYPRKQVHEVVDLSTPSD